MRSRTSHTSETAKTDSQQITGYRLVIAGLTAFLSFSMGLSMFAVGPIMPLIIADYGVSNSTASLLTSITFFVHVVFAIPASMLVGRMGLKTLLWAGATMGSVPILSFMATNSFPLLLTLRAVNGASLILVFPAIAPLFMQWFPPKELPLVNGVFVATGSLGIAASTFLVAPLSETIGWEMVLSGFGGVSFLSAILWLFFGKAQRVSMQSETRSLMMRMGRSEPISNLILDRASSMGRVWRAIRARNTLLVAIADAGPLALLTAALAWLPTFYHEVHGMSLPKGGALMGLLSLAGLVALVSASLLATRIRRRRPFLVIPGILTGFAGFASLLLPDSIPLYIAIAALGFACWFYLPTLLTVPMELYPDNPRQVSIVFATLMSVGGIASAIAPLTVGAIADLTRSFVPGLGIFAVLAWSLAVAGRLLPETGLAWVDTEVSRRKDNARSLSRKVSGN